MSQSSTLKYYIIAGEASGDLHGANLIRALRAKDPEAEIRAWGGDRMEAAGATLVKHYRDLAFMGFVEVLFNLRTILRNLKFCKEDIDAFSPDRLILIDYPGFNMRIATFARERGLRVTYYISPQIWAWKQNRVYKLKRDVDQMLVILPFEKDFYARFGVEAHFVGHPLLDALARRPAFDRNERLQAWGLSPEEPVVALLPGSRKQEIQTMLPLMLAAIKDHSVAVAMAPSQEEAFYRKIVGRREVKLLAGQTYDLLEVADAALVTSGTATLETALFGVPEVVCYKGNWLSYQIARRLVKVPYISLVNLIMDREVVKELIQAQLNRSNLERELRRCLNKEGRAVFEKDYRLLKERLGGEGASAEAARIIVEGI